MPRYQQAKPFDLVRSVKTVQQAVTKMQIQSPGITYQNLNQMTGSLNPNPYFWGGDTAGWAGYNGTFQIATDQPQPSPFAYSALFTITTASAGAALQESASTVPVIPFQQYQVQAWVYTPTTTVLIGFDFQSAPGVFLSTGVQTVTVPANTWTQIQAVVLAPATAAFAYAKLAPTDGVGNTLYVQAVLVNMVTGAYTPGTSTPETWHTITMDSGWSVSSTFGPPMYRMLPDGDVETSGVIQNSASLSANTTINVNNPLPTAYRPSVTRFLHGNTGINNNLGFQVTSGGVLYAIATPSFSGSQVILDNCRFKVP